MSQNAKYKKIASFILSFTLLIIACLYISKIIQDDPKALQYYFAQISVEMVMVIVFIMFIADFINACVWHLINLALAVKTPFSRSYFAWSVARLFRYIPGKVAGFYMRHRLQRSSNKITFYASAIECLINWVPIFYISTVYLILSAQHLLALACFLAGLILSMLKPSIDFVLHRFHNRLNFFEHEPLLFSTGKTHQYSLLVLPALLLYALAFYLIVHFCLNQTDFNLLQAFVTLFTSTIISQLVVFAPSGLIIKEASITLIMSLVGIHPSIALAAATIARILSIISEILQICVATIYKYRRE